jgi:hypothetical protein
MPIGDPGQQQFRDLIPEMRNQHIIAAMAPLMKFRSQIVGMADFKERGGLSDVNRDYLSKLLQACDKWRRVITYNPSRKPLGDRIAVAIGTSELTKGQKDTGAPTDTPLKADDQPFGGDEVQSSPGLMRQVPWAFDGSDVNIPLNSVLNFRSQEGFLVLQAVDDATVSWTRLESRFNTRFITVEDSMRMYAKYIQILEYLQIFAGDENRVDIAVGVMPSEEPRGPGNSPNMKSEDAGTSGIASEALNPKGGTEGNK